MGGRRILSLGVAFVFVLAPSPVSRATTNERVVGAARGAIPLKAPTPAWYTNELHDKVVAAGTRGESVPLPDGVEADSALLFTGIRPGSWMIFPAWCTMNFVFGNPDGTADSSPGKGNGNGKPAKGNSGHSGVYIGTAGHCTDTGEDVTIIAAPGVLMNIGTTVKSIDNGIGDDFALIEVRPEMVQFVNPSMAVAAGPTGAKTPVFGDPIVHVGHGLVVGTGGTMRPGIVTWTGDGSEANGYGWDGAATPGDSGSGVRAATGEAVGNLTHLVVGTRYLPAYIAGTNIDRILQIANAPLATAPLVPNPLP